MFLMDTTPVRRRSTRHTLSEFLETVVPLSWGRKYFFNHILLVCSGVWQMKIVLWKPELDFDQKMFSWLFFGTLMSVFIVDNVNQCYLLLRAFMKDQKDEEFQSSTCYCFMTMWDPLPLHLVVEVSKIFIKKLLNIRPTA